MPAEDGPAMSHNPSAKICSTPGLLRDVQMRLCPDWDGRGHLPHPKIQRAEIAVDNDGTWEVVGSDLLIAERVEGNDLESLVQLFKNCNRRVAAAWLEEAIDDIRDRPAKSAKRQRRQPDAEEDEEKVELDPSLGTFPGQSSRAASRSSRPMSEAEQRAVARELAGKWMPKKFAFMRVPALWWMEVLKCGYEATKAASCIMTVACFTKKAAPHNAGDVQPVILPNEAFRLFGLTSNNVRRAIKSLVDAGLLECKTARGMRATSYQPIWDDLWEYRKTKLKLKHALDS